MLNRFTLLCTLLLLTLFSIAQPKIKLDTFSRTFTSPVDIANDGFSDRLFIVQQNGIIWALDSNGVKIDTFIDLRTKVQVSSEQGLLGLAFHPNYVNNGYFYTYYTKKNSTDNHVVRYKVSSSNPNRAIIDSERVVITLAHPTFTNHNGGCIKFGNDGYLYIAVGDGGSGGDPNGNAQNKNTLLGKLLRIDVNNFAGTYTVPANNPFVGQSNVKTEIWAYGLRNPWRFSFDRLTHDLWIGDVGQGAREEIDFQASNSAGGENYGWRCYEGSNTYNTAGCAGAANYKFPVYEYDHSANGGIAVTGGFVYRGNKYPDLSGYYVCADYGTGNFWLIKKENSVFNTTAIGKPLAGVNISCFGEDIFGELYAANVSNGVIYKIRELCSPFRIGVFQKNNPLCFNSNDGRIELFNTGSNGAVSYVWSNGNNTNTISNLSAGTYRVTATDGIGCVRKDSFVLVKPDTLKINLVNKIDPSCYNSTNGLLEVFATGGSRSYSYNWSNGSTNALITNLAAGKYVLTLKDSNLCTVKDSFTLIKPDTLKINLLRAVNPSCYNTTNGILEVRGVGGNDPYNYNWSNGTTIALNSNLPSGKYVLTMKDSNLCTVKDSFTLTRPDTLKINLLNKINPSCPDVSNGLLQVQGSGGNDPYSYNWSNGNLSFNNNNLAAGNYVITLRDSNLCTVKDTFALINLDTLDKPTISLGIDFLQTQSGFSYKWYQDGNLLVGSTQDTIHPNLAVSAIYQVEITDANGCKAISDTFQHIWLSTKNNNTVIEKFSLFPNPASNQLTINIDFKMKQTAFLKIINSIGQIVYDERIVADKISKIIPVQTLPKGLYQLSIFMDDGKVSSQAFIKE
ncbi:MAG: PQQ-dependent sugar dehydrogenase [Chitinophagales bacterium]